VDDGTGFVLLEMVDAAVWEGIKSSGSKTAATGISSSGSTDTTSSLLIGISFLPNLSKGPELGNPIRARDFDVDGPGPASAEGSISAFGFFVGLAVDLRR
jgi:hypothetical protein